MILRRNSHPIDMNQARTGFTLVELLISIAVISILAGMAAQVFSVLLQSREIAMRRIEISETANAALEFMAAEIRSAYLTPNSVKPRLTADSPQPRFRFAGISRNVVIDEIEDDEVKARIPGAGEDDDGDGWIDEEFLDGVDEDYNPVDSAPALGGRGRPREEPIPCEEGDSSCIDEDIGAFPSDMLHFVSAVENSGQLVLSEVSYGLDPAGLKLVRRAQVMSNGSQQQRDFEDFGQFVDDRSRKRLVPPAPVLGELMPLNNVRQAILNWDQGAKNGTLSAGGGVGSGYLDRLFEVLAYDVRGLRFRYWYYDYNRGGWRYAKEWDSARETAFVPPNVNLLNQPAANNSMEGLRRGAGFTSLIVNEPEDAYPRVNGVGTNFLVNQPQTLVNQLRTRNGDYINTAESIALRTDGLPNMVEITLYVQDRDRVRNPRAFSTRVFVPNNYKSIGS